MDIWLVIKLVGALGAGFIVFSLFGMFIFTSSVESKREEKVKRLEQAHINAGIRETNREVELTYAAMATPQGSNERKWLDDMYTEEKAQHVAASNKRIKEIVETQCPVDDATWAELQAGINPYKRRKR